MNRTFLHSHFVVACGLLAVVGCGSPQFSPTEGIVTLDGQPLADATVVFQAPDRPLATAKTNHEGRYRVVTGGAQGMKPGEYSVTIAAYEKPKEVADDEAPNLAIPEKYVQAESSGLKAVIVAGENRNVNFELMAN